MLAERAFYCLCLAPRKCRHAVEIDKHDGNRDDEAKAKEAMEKAKAAAKTAASEIELAKVEAEIGMLAEQLRILQRIKH